MIDHRGLIVRELALRDFRSYAQLELALEPGVVLVVGPNGAGKTNLLEAVHVGTQGFSPRARHDAQMVRFGASVARVRVAAAAGDRRFEVDLALSAREARQTRLNGADVRSGEEVRRELRTLVFTPDRLAIVKGGPAVRRAYLDRAAGRLFPSRAAIPAEYAATVVQRNAALRRVAAGLSSRDALEPWTEAVAATGRSLVDARMATVELLAPGFERSSARLGLDAALLAYEGEGPTIAALERRLEKDLERGLTGYGPHLHDLRIAASSRDLRTYGSQGEQRSAVLALVFAEASALADRAGGPPLVLLDDVLSELDEGRRRALAEMVSTTGQAIVTSTSASALPLEPSQLVVVTPGSAVDASVR